ncbi:hypothetical protein GCM10018789_00110 [Streptomyces werraensis]|nr:hypothetical protein GCM10018789_00110 [Streptomyces werraensis]
MQHTLLADTDSTAVPGAGLWTAGRGSAVEVGAEGRGRLRRLCEGVAVDGRGRGSPRGPGGGSAGLGRRVRGAWEAGLWGAWEAISWSPGRRVCGVREAGQSRFGRRVSRGPSRLMRAGWVTAAGKRECGGSVPRAITGADGRTAAAVRRRSAPAPLPVVPRRS